MLLANRHRRTFRDITHRFNAIAIMVAPLLLIMIKTSFTHVKASRVIAHRSPTRRIAVGSLVPQDVFSHSENI